MKPKKDTLDDLLHRHMDLSTVTPPKLSQASAERILNAVVNAGEESDVSSVEGRTGPRTWSLLLAAGAAVLVMVLVVFIRMPAMRHIQKLSGSLHAIVESTDSGLFRVSGGQAVRAGEKVEEGDIVRTDRGLGAVLALADGSRIEMRPQSALSLEQAADGARIRLDTGGVIITAAKQRAGHLYVRTKDATVSVVGTVFLVSTEQAGSRVAVIQGEVQVQQGAIIERLSPGQQVATNPLMESHPVREQISWSREAPAHMALLQQSAPPAKIQGAPAPKQQFEAASLKPLPLSRGSIPPQFLECKGVDGTWSYAKDQAFAGEGTVSPVAVPLGRCIGATLRRDFVAIAYDIRPDRISGDEGDAGSHYQLEAKADDPSRATKGELRQMLQALAIDRFKLKAHRYTEERLGYVLGVAKSGVKIKEASGDEEIPREQSMGRFVRGAPSQLLPILIQGKCSLRTFAQYLSGGPTQGLPVVDKTDLPGIYEISLTLNQVMGGPSGPRGGGATTAPQDMWDPPLAKALEDQLGLRLESVGKVPVEYLAVDHVEKPSEN